MGRQSLYSEEFRRDAVALYRTAEGKRNYAVVAADLGIGAEAWQTLVQGYRRKARSEDHGTGGVKTETDEFARLRAKISRLRGAEEKGQLERGILRRAAAISQRR